MSLDPKMYPKAILIHRSETGHDGAEVNAAEAKQGCGYHYFIRESGRIDAMIDWPGSVWHALRYSKFCLGIAIYGDFDPREGSIHSVPNANQLASAANLIASIYQEYGPIPVFGHTDLPHATAFFDKRCPGPNLDVHRLQIAGFVEFWKRLQPAEVAPT